MFYKVENFVSSFFQLLGVVIDSILVVADQWFRWRSLPAPAFLAQPLPPVHFSMLRVSRKSKSPPRGGGSEPLPVSLGLYRQWYPAPKHLGGIEPRKIFGAKRPKKYNPRARSARFFVILAFLRGNQGFA